MAAPAALAALLLTPFGVLTCPGVACYGTPPGVHAYFKADVGCSVCSGTLFLTVDRKPWGTLECEPLPVETPQPVWWCGEVPR